MDTVVNNFWNRMRQLDRKNYTFTMLVYDIAPTLSGDKCACLITLSKTNKNMYDVWDNYKSELLSNLPLKYFEIKSRSKYTVFFYDEEKLKRIILGDECSELLYRFGYEKNMNLQPYLNKLKDKLKNELPHEIGLFLGIPLEDVECFIKNCGKKFLYCGYWKVYGKKDAALNIFSKYDSVKRLVIKLVGEGEDYNQVLNYLYKLRYR